MSYPVVCEGAAKPMSRRGRILVNLVRQLSTIRKENGYGTDVVNVTTEIQNWDLTAEGDTPVIYIVDQQATPQYNPSRLTEWTWTIALTGLMKNKSQLDMEAMVADIQDALFKNITLSFDGEIPGPCSQIRIADVVTDGQFMRELDGSQLFTVKIQVKYTASAFSAL